MHYLKTLVTAAAAALVLSACSSSTTEIIDLNRVLDVMVDTFDQMEGRAQGDALSETADEAAQQQWMQEFNTAYAGNLNAAQIYSKPLGTEVLADGSISGIVDDNQNMIRDNGEAQLFTVEIDAERNRLIATDTQNGYHRDLGFSFTGLMAGMLIGHMLSRQRAAGVNTSKFRNMQMSPKNYHASASSATSARAKSGSGSFSSGK